jgi:hypothetical protein
MQSYTSAGKPLNTFDDITDCPPLAVLGLAAMFSVSGCHCLGNALFDLSASQGVLTSFGAVSNLYFFDAAVAVVAVVAVLTSLWALEMDDRVDTGELGTFLAARPLETLEVRVGKIVLTDVTEI